MGLIVFRAGEQDGHGKKNNIYSASDSAGADTHSVNFLNFNWAKSIFMHFLLRK